MFQTIRMLDRAKSVIVSRHAYYIQNMQSISLQKLWIRHEDLTEQFVMCVCHSSSAWKLQWNYNCKQIPNINFIAMRASLAARLDSMSVIAASMMHFNALHSLRQTCITAYVPWSHDLLGSANQCTLMNMYLRSNISWDPIDQEKLSNTASSTDGREEVCVTHCSRQKGYTRRARLAQQAQSLWLVMHTVNKSWVTQHRNQQACESLNNNCTMLALCYSRAVYQ